MILDTNALSAMADGDPALLPVLERTPHLHLPAIVLGEYRYGIARSRFATRLKRWTDELEQVCSILVVDQHTARHYASIRSDLRKKGKPIPENDIWISALALQHRLEIISHDSHFDLVKGLHRASW